ncbi:MAG: cytochrome c biogenesis CcdA family protein [Thermoplasmata archaeon]
MADPVLLSFAYGAGVISFFSPCAFPMLPAYVSYYLGQDNPTGEAPLAQGLKVGGLTLLGMLSIFGGLGLVLTFIGSQFLAQAIPLFGLGMGVLLVALGALLLVTDRLSFTLPIRAPSFRGPLSLYLYGVAYALVSLGCTFPIFLLVVTGAILTQGLLQGAVVFLAYAVGMGTVMIFVSLAVSTSKDYVADSMRRVVPLVKPISAIILLAVGAYMVYFYYGLYFV